MNKTPLLCLMGPTGTGKSALALQIAKNFNGAIINADSRQVYTDFPCITAQPDEEEKALCPHELYGFLPTEKNISAGIWLDLAEEAIQKAHDAGRLPMLVGGTGLYYRALLDGIVAIPAIDETVQNALNLRLEEQSLQALYEELLEHDPVYAARIHFNDKQRILRALEVFYSTGKAFSCWHDETPAPPPYNVLRLGLGLPLNELAPFLSQRIEMMIGDESKRNRAFSEAAMAYEKCPDLTAPGWSGIGCKEALAMHLGEMSFEEGKADWFLKTRAYAKRQWTWFRGASFQGEKKIEWFRPDEDCEKILEYVKKWKKN